VTLAYLRELAASDTPPRSANGNGAA